MVPGSREGPQWGNHIYICLYWKKSSPEPAGQFQSNLISTNHPWVKGIQSYTNKRPRGHIAHLSHKGQFFLHTYKSNFPPCCFTGSLGAMSLYETHFCIWTSNLYVLNSSDAADMEIFFIILPLTTHLKRVFPNVAPIVPYSALY
jgi:hypothetical protein